MKYLIILILLFSQNTFAISFSKNERSYWIERIKLSCQKSFYKKHDQKTINLSAKICECVAQNFLALSEEELIKKTAFNQLNWIDLYYSKQLTEEEINNDPFFLDDYIYTIGNSCLNSSEFRL